MILNRQHIHINYNYLIDVKHMLKKTINKKERMVQQIAQVATINIDVQ